MPKISKEKLIAYLNKQSMTATDPEIANKYNELIAQCHSLTAQGADEQHSLAVINRGASVNGVVFPGIHGNLADTLHVSEVKQFLTAHLGENGREQLLKSRAYAAGQIADAILRTYFEQESHILKIPATHKRISFLKNGDDIICRTEFGGPCQIMPISGDEAVGAIALSLNITFKSNPEDNSLEIIDIDADTNAYAIIRGKLSIKKIIRRETTSHNKWRIKAAEKLEALEAEIAELNKKADEHLRAAQQAQAAEDLEEAKRRMIDAGTGQVLSAHLMEEKTLLKREYFPLAPRGISQVYSNFTVDDDDENDLKGKLVDHVLKTFEPNQSPEVIAAVRQFDNKCRVSRDMPALDHNNPTREQQTQVDRPDNIARREFSTTAFQDHYKKLCATGLESSFGHQHRGSLQKIWDIFTSILVIPVFYRVIKYGSFFTPKKTARVLNENLHTAATVPARRFDPTSAG